MLPNNQQSETWKLALKFISQCPVCNTKYEDAQARLSGKKEHAHLVHFSCLQCGSYFVAMVMEVGAGINSVGTITDLNYEDTKRIMELPMITLDEVLDAHHYIKNFQSKNFIR